MARKKISNQAKLEELSPSEMTLFLPKSLPLLPMRDVVVFPYLILPLFVGRDSSLAAVESSLEGEQLIFLTAQKNNTDDDLGADEIGRASCRERV